MAVSVPKWIDGTPVRLHRFQNDSRIGQDILVIVVGTKCADPTIEELDGLRAGVDLRDEIIGNHLREFAHQ